MKKIEIAMVCKIMPYYRLGIFQRLTEIDKDYRFTFLGDIKEEGGIKPIPDSYVLNTNKPKIRWVKTKNYFYKSEGLLWQTGIIKEIFRSKYKAFVFEGGIRHYPIWLFAFLCKLRGKKVIYWTHGNRGLDKGIIKFLRVIFFKWLGNSLFLYGNTQRDIMIEDGYHPNKLFVIYNSLQPEKQFDTFNKLLSNDYLPLKSKLFDNPNNFTLIFIGRLVRGKGVLDILKLVKKCKEDDILINCIFIGEGSEKENMISYSKDNTIENQLYFTGALYDENEIAPYFMMSNLMISPGNVGLNCIHSMGYGVPVFTHDNFWYQNPEVEAINEKTGFFYKHNNFDDMFFQLKQWIEKKPSKSVLRNNCQAVIKEVYNPNYQATCMISGLNSLFNE